MTSTAEGAACGSSSSCARAGCSGGRAHRRQQGIIYAAMATGVALLERLRRQPDASEFAVARGVGPRAGDRVHLDCGGRYVTVVRLEDGTLACVDSVCYHDGGGLGAGDLEDGVLVCPAHGFRVCARTGDAREGGDRARAAARQRVHVAYEAGDAVRVRVSRGGTRPSDRFAASEAWHDTRWREVVAATPVAPPD